MLRCVEQNILLMPCVLLWRKMYTCFNYDQQLLCRCFIKILSYNKGGFNHSIWQANCTNNTYLGDKDQQWKRAFYCLGYDLSVGTNTPPTIAATIPALPPPIGLNGYSSLPATTNGQQATETLYTNGVHPYQGILTKSGIQSFRAATILWLMDYLINRQRFW